MNHTPTPYKVIDEHLVASVTGNEITVVADCYAPKNMPVADAKFIALACNAHYDLVEALEMLLQNFEEGLPLRWASHRRAEFALKLARGE